MKQIQIIVYPNKLCAEAIVESGFIDELADYVRNVKWLFWKKGKKRQIVISGFAKEDSETAYLKRVQVFAQRMMQCGVIVLIKNKSDKTWSSFENPCLPEKQLLEIELERVRDVSSKEYWATQDIRVYTELLQKSENTNADNSVEFLKKRLNQSQTIIDEEREFEKKRVASLKNLWTKYKKEEIENEAGILDSFDYYL